MLELRPQDFVDDLERERFGNAVSVPLVDHDYHAEADRRHERRLSQVARNSPAMGYKLKVRVVSAKSASHGVDKTNLMSSI